MNVSADDLFSLRLASDDDMELIMQAHSRVFGTRSDTRHRANWKRQTNVDDILLAVEKHGREEKFVGTAMYYDMTLGLPGGTEIAAAGGGMSLVEPTHRRRGIFRSMYSELLRLAQSRHYPVLVGMPSQGTIYRRFGRGPASQAQSLVIDRRRATLCVPTRTAYTVQCREAAETVQVIPSLYRAYAAVTPGAVSRSDAWWDLYFESGSIGSHIESRRFYFTHPEGYATYRIQEHAGGSAVVKVEELCASTDEAHSDLWDAVLGLEAFDTVVAETSPSDPLPLKLVDLRAARIADLRDVMWLRILDVPVALSARGYTVDGEVVIGVEDPLDLSGGTFRLRAIDGTGYCDRIDTDTKPDLVLTLDNLSSLYLGGFDAHQLASAGRLHVNNPSALSTAESLFRSNVRPFCNTYF
ncbi:GNAT family N-acetyltransferase [Mycobacteroides abscessus subsp. abscessus]|nr:GNAT family N-acetyltransferase [Mycobacteroides abscessus subsp. abscessus]